MTQGTSNSTVTIAATSAQAMKAVAGQLRRTSFIIVNTSASAVVTVAKGDSAAVAGIGIVIQPTGSYTESTSENFTCWQGAVQAIGTGAGSIAVVESWEA